MKIDDLLVESGDVISWKGPKRREIGMIADRGGAGGWRVVVIVGPNIGVIVLGNDCDDAKIILPVEIVQQRVTQMLEVGTR